jgi:glycosyltransferase involved in cell wall biosynthesis
MTAKTICLDGFNLAMSQSSGIGTYTRNLNTSLRNIGFETQVLYGPERGPSRNSLLNEIALYDASPTPGALGKVSAALKMGIASLTSPLGRAAKPVRLSGAVLGASGTQGRPSFDDVWTSRYVFEAANRAFATFGLFTPLRFSKSEGQGRPPDVMHWTCPLPLRAPGRANLYTIHDLVPLRLPFATLDNKRRFLELCRRICSEADRVVTVSEHSKRDLVEILGVDETRIAVTYQSVHLPSTVTDRSEADVAQEVEGVFGLDWRGYFIFFGAIEPKKNLARIIEAYLGSGVAAPLIIIGGRAWLDDRETQMLYTDIVEVSALREGMIRRADRIRRYEYLPFNLLVSLIRGAKATLLPSLYEGFGLPVLESMLLGTPVLTSTAGSLPEVAGDAALLVDPYDVRDIREGIVELDRDSDLRSHLTDCGLKQAAKFSPEIYETRLNDLYRTL